MRVAVLHDHLSFIGGGERVALTLAEAFDADLYVADLDPTLPARAGMPGVRPVEIARVPQRPPFRQDRQIRAFQEVSVPDHDVYVLSGNWAVFAAPRHRPNLWYCHTPVRIFYDLQEPFVDSLTRAGRWAARRWINSRRPQYEAAAASAQRIVANSRNVALRIERYLHRDSVVVFPPVDTARYRFREIGDFWLSVNRLSHEKRIDLQVDAFRRLPNDRLVIVGGPEPGAPVNRVVRSLNPPPNVAFVGEVDDERLRDLYGRCRGLLATAVDEDFGLAPVEAMASGKAVIAVDEGGYRESVVHRETGTLVSPTVDAIADAIRRASTDDLERMRSACEAQARRFDVKRFVEQMRALVDETAGGSGTRSTEEISSAAPFRKR